MMEESEIEAKRMYEGYAIVGSYETAKSAHEAGLVILASGNPYWLRYDEGRYLLVVESSVAGRMKREIDATTEANRFWPPLPLDLPNKRLSKWPTIAAVFYLVVMFGWESARPELKTLGANSSEAVLEQGEWWRLLTAVSLHADVGHLLGNLMGIVLFGYLAARYLGNGVAWMLILLAAACANLSNALLNFGTAFTSLGASTAVFAALGLLAGYPLGAGARSQSDSKGHVARDWLLPFFAGCVLFAWMGGGDFPTDVSGHLLSFGFGLLFAVTVARLGVIERVGAFWQNLALGLTVAALALSWFCALG